MVHEEVTLLVRLMNVIMYWSGQSVLIVWKVRITHFEFLLSQAKQLHDKPNLQAGFVQFHFLPLMDHVEVCWQ